MSDGPDPAGGGPDGSPGGDGARGDGTADPAATVEVRPSRIVAAAMAVVAALSGAVAVSGVVGGEPLLGVVALASAAWLASLAWTSWRAWSVADRDGVEVVWVRSRRRVAWDEVDSVVIEGVIAGGVLGSTTLVVRSGDHLRWAPWYPFLFFAHPSVRRSIDRLSAMARTRGIDVVDVADDAGDGGPAGAARPRR